LLRTCDSGGDRLGIVAVDTAQPAASKRFT
jgi:hypothetical protein